MFGFFIKNNLGQISFDASRGQLMQFIGRYPMTQSGEECISSLFQCSGYPLAFVRNTAVSGGAMIVTGIRNTSGNTWEVSATGTGAAGNVISGEVYIFGLKTANKPMSGYGFVIKSDIPGGLDFFDARDRILRLECYARSINASGWTGTSPPPVPVQVIGGTIPVNWAVCASFPHGFGVVQVDSTASADIYPAIGRIDANTCDLMRPSIMMTGNIRSVAERGTYETVTGFSAYFIDTSLYQ